MPLFTAVKSSRLPSIKPSETDVYSLTASVAELRGQLAEINSSLKVLIDSNVRSEVLELTASVTQLQTQMAEVVCSLQHALVDQQTTQRAPNGTQSSLSSSSDAASDSLRPQRNCMVSVIQTERLEPS